MPITINLSVADAALDETRVEFYKAGDGTKRVTATFRVVEANGNQRNFTIDKRVSDVVTWSSSERTTLLGLLTEWLTEARADLGLTP